MGAYRFEAAQLSDVGTTRTVNEDSCTLLQRETQTGSVLLAAVADGVGGLAQGENASAMAIEAIETWWDAVDWSSAPTLDKLLQDLAQCVQNANMEIYRAATQAGKRTGTTLSVFLLANDGYFLYHVGDSRIYKISGGMFNSVEQLTTDHVTVQPKIVGDTTIMKSFLTDCLGYAPSFKSQQEAGQHKAGDVYLVCSDGIYKTLPDKTIGKLVRKQKSNIERACHDLIEQAKANGETDNLTALVVKIIN